ncbi:MAG: uroporphyrinogen decarboxylase family protein [Thermoguttaceae bacterium]|jgi:[methyl-Co(III) methanol-specific corrinoid protein]:coenzyme M methyltransferase|nr:uroporphyrinogen decarboxylase family protein [Thermoguttaceae bacterium]
MSPREIFLAKLRGESSTRAAVGSATSIVTSDLMDEVGAWFPEAHLDAEPMARLAAAGHTLLGFDNVMPLFSVWHESAALGCPVNWGTRTRMPDCRDRLCGDIGELPVIPPGLLKHPGCAVPLEAIGRLRRELGETAAVVGKVFGPWTLGYHVYGVDRFLMATIDKPDSLRRAMRCLMEVSVRFGVAQIEAGADAITLADHATRDLCSPANYRDFLLEMHRELHERLPCPLILHICGDTSDRIPYIATTGIECFHFDSKVPTVTASKLAGDRLALMGGTSNFRVVREGTPELIAADVAEKAAHRIDIIGPECAVPLDAPWRNLRLLAREGKRV